jgi:small subunit ribosomal protein S14
MAQMKKKQKHDVQARNRCQRCGRPRAYMRKFALCRICFRNLALQGYLPGVIKASW